MTEVDVVRTGGQRGPGGLRRLTLGAYRVYQHISGVFSAISLMSFVATGFHVELKGIIAAGVDLWRAYVHPWVEGLLHGIWRLLNLWWDLPPLELSSLQVDYYAAGLILLTSSVRSFRSSTVESRVDPVPKRQAPPRWRFLFLPLVVPLALLAAALIILLFLFVVGVWPLLLIAIAIAAPQRDGPNDKGLRAQLWLILSPFLYLLALLVINVFLAR